MNRINNRLMDMYDGLVVIREEWGGEWGKTNKMLNKQTNNIH